MPFHFLGIYLEEEADGSHQEAAHGGDAFPSSLRFCFIGPVCFRFSQTRLDYNLSEDFLASRFSLLVVQISEAAYHISENWWK